MHFFAQIPNKSWKLNLVEACWKHYLAAQKDLREQVVSSPKSNFQIYGHIHKGEFVYFAAAFVYQASFMGAMCFQQLYPQNSP